MASAITERSPAIAALAGDWPMLEALMQGTRAMRACQATLLPKWPNEEETSYANRIATATLFPAYRRTVSVMAGKPFSQAVALSEDTPAEIAGTETVEGWVADIDRGGVNLHTFAAEMLTEALAYGLAGIMVDAPVIDAGGGPRTRKLERDSNWRPYFVRVHHSQIIGFRTVGPRLTQLRLAETALVDVGEYGQKLVQRVRVLTPGAWAVYEKDEQPANLPGEEKWVLIEEGLTNLSFIPFVPLYGRRDGFMCGRPPLIDLAFLNVKHWQSQSDQDTILHVARVPILSVTGANDESKLVVGAASFVRLPLGAEMKFVEHTGAAIEAGAASLNDLEDQMIQAGAELLVKKPGARSATESANDAEGNKSDLQRIVEGFEDSLDAALWMVAQYAGLPSGGSASLFKDFGAATLSEASGQLVVSMAEARVISKATAIEELKRRGELAADVDPEEEQAKIALQPADQPVVVPLA